MKRGLFSWQGRVSACCLGMVFLGQSVAFADPIETPPAEAAKAKVKKGVQKAVAKGVAKSAAGSASRKGVLIPPAALGASEASKEAMPSSIVTQTAAVSDSGVTSEGAVAATTAKVDLPTEVTQTGEKGATPAQVVKSVPDTENMAEEVLPFETSGPESREVDPDALDYGRVFVAEKTQHPWHRFRVSGQYGREFGDAYFLNQVVSLGAEFSIVRYLWTGIQWNYYFSATTSVLRNLDRALFQQKVLVESTLSVPKNAFYWTQTFVPFSGHFSFLFKRPLEVELGLRTGFGMVRMPYKKNELGFLWSVRPTVYLADQVLLQMGFGQELIAPFKKKFPRPFFYRGDVALVVEF